VPHATSLSLALIVKNEQETLPRLLDSIKGCFDEIVVVDTGSSDDTKKIALSHGARVYDFEWIDDFSAARNDSFSKVTSAWTMWMDADDILRPEDRDKLIALKPTLGKADAYLMTYNYAQDDFDRPICQFYRHRILRTSLNIRWELPIHEHLVIPPNISQAMTNIVITHKRTGAGAAADNGRNVRMLRTALKARPDNQRLKFYLAKELFNEMERPESIRLFEEYLQKGDWHENQVNAHFWLAMGYWALKQEEKAIDAAMRGIRLDPRWAEFYSMIGQIYYDRGDWGRAVQWFEIAAATRIPETWGTVLTDNYTWVPRDRLAKCWAELGDWSKAYQYNEAALRYRPTDKRLLFNRLYLRDQLYDRLSARPVRLNLGSGGKPCSGYRNADLYMGLGVEFQMDQGNIPYDDSMVHAIRSEHALEHSDSHYDAEAAIQEWARALRYGGRLHLMVPDLDKCCASFVASEDRERKDGERWTEKEWYKYTIYGIQRGQAHEPDAGQYHRTGFTKPQLKRLLEKAGFNVESIENYDGWGTPSIEVHAVQSAKQPSIAWALRGGDVNDPSTRIRRLNVSSRLSENGVKSAVIVNYTQESQNAGALFQKLRKYDVVVFSFFGDLERQAMDLLQLSGVSTVADYNEDLADLSPEVAACLQSASIIVCCSKELAKRAEKYGRTMVIVDAYET